MIFKEMTEASLREAAALFVQAFNSEPWNDRWTENTAYRRLLPMLRAENAFGLCMYRDDNQLCGMLLGHLEIYYDGTEFLLKEFAVDHNMRGQGLGTLLMDELKRRLKTKNVKRICLATITGNQTEKFYRNQGFDTDPDSIIMKINLPK